MLMRSPSTWIPRDKEYLMRRIALLVLCLGATGCDSVVSSPFVGFGGFLADTHTYQRGPNSPVGNSENMLRVRGQGPTIEPLVPEAGNVWPGPAEAMPTLEDLIKENNAGQLLPGDQMAITPYGTTRPPAGAPPASQFTPPPSRPPSASPQSGAGATTFTDPKGGTGLLVPNGNGTSTLIGPDGSVKTVPTPN